MRLAGLILLISFVATSCCDECGGEFWPCETTYLGLINLSPEALALPPMNNEEVMTFVFKRESPILYTLARSERDSTPIIDCDSTMFVETKRVSYSPDFTAPEMSFSLSYSKHANPNPGIESFGLSIGTFWVSCDISDSLKSSNKEIEVEYHSSFRAIQTNFTDVYVMSRTKREPNRVNFVCYSRSEGVLAFWMDNDQYWLRK